MTDLTIPSQLPLRNNITTARNLSMIFAVWMGIMSLAGLILTERIYPTEEQVQSFMTNDLTNLVIGLPILLGSMWLARQGKLIGILLWPGALLYDFYNYIVSVFGRPFDLLTIVYLALVLLSAYIIFDLLKNIDPKSVQEGLAGAVPEKIAGWVMVVFGAAFIFRAVSIIAGAITNQTILPISEIGLLIADMVLSVFWIAGGVLLLRRMPFGYVGGLGLLFAASMLFVGLIIVLLLQPVLTDAPFVLVDVIVVAVMGLIGFIPFGLFVRGVLSEGKIS